MSPKKTVNGMAVEKSSRGTPKRKHKVDLFGSIQINPFYFLLLFQLYFAAVVSCLAGEALTEEPEFKGMEMERAM